MSETFINLDDLKIAFSVCMSLSLSKTSEEYGISNATIIRRLDRVEKALGVKLFIRHPRGYKPTDAGDTLKAEFPALLNLASQIRQKICQQQNDLSGVLKVTLLPEISTQMNDVLKSFRLLHPEVRVSLFASDEVLALNQGDYHVALRAGKVSHAPDLIVKKLYQMPYAYYASAEYIEQYGKPNNKQDYDKFEWVLPTGKKTKISFVKKVMDVIHPSSISYQSNNLLDIESAVHCGMGIGPIEMNRAQRLDNLVQIDCCGIDRENYLFFAYHKDQKNNNRIDSFYQHLTSHVKKWTKF